MTAGAPDRRFAGHDPMAGQDTASVPWAGRRITDTGFGADDGGADPAVRAALRTLARAPHLGSRDAAEAELVRLLRAGRVLVPVAAASRQVDDGGDLPRDDGADMATMVLTGPDGRRGQPAFTGIDTLAAWHAQARPVPVPAVLAARAALEDTCDVLLLDLGASDAAVLRLSHVWALAQDRDWAPAHLDPVVTDAVAAAADAASEPVDARPEAGPVPGVLRLILRLRPGLDAAGAEALATGVAEFLAADPEVRCRLDEVTFTLRAAAGR